MGSRKHHHRGAGSSPERPPSDPPQLPEEPTPPTRLDDSGGLDDHDADVDVDRGAPLAVLPPVAALPSQPTLPTLPTLPTVPSTESAAVAPSALKDLRRDVAESHAVTVRTANAVTTLAGSLKEVITRQSRYDRGLNLNSFVAYVLFTALLGTGFYMLYRTRADQLVTERDQALRGQKTAIDEAAAARAELAERDASQRKALDFWTLISGGKRDEAIARYGEIMHERLSPVETQVFQQGVARARAEIVDSGFAEGVEAFQGQQWKRAAAAFKKSLSYEEEGPRAAQMRYYFGVSLHKLGDFSEAGRQLELSLAGGTERTFGVDARFYLAGAYEQLRQHDKARSEYEKFASGHPMHPWAGLARRRQAEMALKGKPPQ